MRKKPIKKIAAGLLKRANVTDIPIRIKEVAEYLNVNVEPAELGGDISGILVVRKKGGTIGYNHSEPNVRQRFSIAHELGHYVLHREMMPLFVDRGYAVAFRDQNSSSGDIQQEREANAFAAAILMPEELIRAELDKLDFDLGGDEESLRTLSANFEVSTQAMSYRLANLQIFNIE